MRTKTSTNPTFYKGCYNCKFFERLNKNLGGYGKCLNPLKEAFFCLDIKYVENGTFRYPDKYYPTAIICCIDNCNNWEETDVR